MSLNSKQIKKLGWELIGQIGVNSGQVVVGDPSEILEREPYMELINIKGNLRKFNKSLVIPSGWGDGNYHVYVQKNDNGRILRLMIDFTTTFGFDNENRELHDIEVEDIDEECKKYMMEKSKNESV